MTIISINSGMKDLPDASVTTANGNVLRFELNEISPLSKEVARKELRETPENIENGINEMCRLLEQEPEIVWPKENKEWLLRFLRPCKYHVDSAMELLRNYFKFKIKHFDVYNGLKPSNEMNVMKANMLTVFPHRDQLGRRVLVLGLGKKWKHKEVCLDEVFKCAAILLEASAYEPNTQINGALVIFDMDGLTLQQTWQFTPPFAKRIADWLQDAVPMRIKAIHVVNQPKIFNIVFALFKPFLREKLRKRIYFHGVDRESLHKHMSPECLPAEYGGTHPKELPLSEDWLKLFLQFDDLYDELNNYGYVKQRDELIVKKKTK